MGCVDRRRPTDLGLPRSPAPAREVANVAERGCAVCAELASETADSTRVVFDDGDFSENETFLITDWFKHTPRDVLAKNFGVSESAFANIPIDVEHGDTLGEESLLEHMLLEPDLVLAAAADEQ